MNQIRNKLDFEHKGRINEIFKFYEEKNEFIIEDILSNKSVAEKFGNQKLIIPHFNRDKILISYPFSNEIYVQFCPSCLSWTSLEELKLFLEFRAFIPVLTHPYYKYPEAFQDLLIKYPHISVYEFSFLRSTILFSNSDNGICPHCISQIKKDFKLISNQSKGIRRMTNDIFGYLYPYIDHDSELLLEYGSALSKDNHVYLQQLVDFSRSIWDARTAQVLNGRSLFHSYDLPKLMNRTSKILPSIDGNEMGLIESALLQNVKINIPIDEDISKFFKYMDPYRSELSSIAESIISDSNKSPALQTISLNNSLSELNDQLSKLSRNKRYLTYQAILGFTKTNKLLLGSVLVASIFGLVPGCGALTASIAGKVAKKYGKLDIPNDAIPLVSELKHSIRPNLNKLLSIYTNIDFKAIQLFEIRKSLEKDLKNKL